MIGKIDCFLLCGDLSDMGETITALQQSKAVKQIYLLLPEVEKDKAEQTTAVNGLRLLESDGLSTKTMKSIAENATAPFVLISSKAQPFRIGLHALNRMASVAEDSGAGIVYGDRREERGGQLQPHPVIDYQRGSLRDDFDFGQLLLVQTSLLKSYAAETQAAYHWAGLYDFRLYVSRQAEILHLNEMLYTETETDVRLSGEKQFDYVNPRNRDVQVEMEAAVTHHLEAIGALVDNANYAVPDFAEQDFESEASVIIPVFNRERTVADAVRSALAQQTDFAFNVIVVDNHSTDGTTAILNELEKTDNRLIHIIPKQHDLGIGGCWNLAIDDLRCGRFAVQLDSDDLYSSPRTLQTIVRAFYDQQAAMIVGSYRICNFDLETLPPGIIDHREWTEQNGANNALRINGLGAPRAFFTPIARHVRFPNTSYGEDYAVGLAFSRRWRIGRIYDELYLCRRWSGNSDAALSIERVNANNLYKDRLRTIELSARLRVQTNNGRNEDEDALRRFFTRQLETWAEADKNYRDLQDVKSRELHCGNSMLRIQYNPARMVSTGASIDKKTITQRPCFLCAAQRPQEQIVKAIDSRFEMLVNPYPILPLHLTLPTRSHQPQQIKGNFHEFYKILGRYPRLMVFYNGPRCGASAPDHAHLQAGTSGMLPLQTEWARLSSNAETLLTERDGATIVLVKDYVVPVFAIRCKQTDDGLALFGKLYKALPRPEDGGEPMMNIIAWRNDREYIVAVIPRQKHRPDCYYSEQESEKRIVSPGALDMAGLIITPRKDDFDRLTEAESVAILKECGITPEQAQAIVKRLVRNGSTPSTSPLKSGKEPIVSVGIVSGSEINFSLNTPYTAKGERIEGNQTVAFSDGAILWNGNLYRELTFTPISHEASFSLRDVTIGLNFHWERKETQTFRGSLHLVVESDSVYAINELPVEQYLESVISSEMCATSSLELLKAHAVISRSWLLAQMQQRRNQQGRGTGFFSFIKKDDELIRWYDREDHTIFDVCADDHCQRYQGITKTTNPQVAEAVAATKGEVLMSEGEICDARFSKCCGGVTEEFQYCWENKSMPYLKAIRDVAGQNLQPDLTVEKNADEWIRTAPASFCNTADKRILTQVLNDYDRETADFYRWEVCYSQEELQKLVCEKLKIEFGNIIDLIPLERGKSGRISRLKIVGSNRNFTIGKELEIRRALSETHLYSSAFVVDKDCDEHGIPTSFKLIGAGWGHGVGLCQIGAAVMGEKGYAYDKILLHYYHGAEIKKRYE